MKTPREILLARHENAAPKLDAIRRAAVEDLKINEQPGQNKFIAWFSSCSKNLYRELVFPSRRLWAGLAATWLLLLLVNFSLRDRSNAATKPAPPEMTMTLRDQQIFLNELFADRSLPMDVERPRIYSPKPRTQTTELLTA
jgi:hypothetical protein